MAARRHDDTGAVPDRPDAGLDRYRALRPTTATVTDSHDLDSPDDCDDPDDHNWAAQYLETILADPPSEASAEQGPAPEAGEFMTDLTDANLSYVHPRSRADHLEPSVAALAAALADDDGVGEAALHGRPASAYRDDERVVVLMEGLGEVINVDRGTAALVAFAYERGREREHGER